MVKPKQINNTGLVGKIMFEKPSPKQYAVTVVCLVTPTRSERGIRMGISRKALADPDATKNSMSRTRM